MCVDVERDRAESKTTPRVFFDGGPRRRASVFFSVIIYLYDCMKCDCGRYRCLCGIIVFDFPLLCCSGDEQLLQSGNQVCGRVTTGFSPVTEVSTGLSQCFSPLFSVCLFFFLSFCLSFVFRSFFCSVCVCVRCIIFLFSCALSYLYFLQRTDCNYNYILNKDYTGCCLRKSPTPLNI